MTDEKNSSLNLTMKLSTATTWMVIIGLIIICLSKIFQDFKVEGWFWVLLIDILEPLGTTVLSAGLVSVLVEISTIRNLVAYAFKKILSGNLDLKGLNYKTLDNAKKNIAGNMLNLNNRELANTPYKYEEKLLELVNQKYYKHHNITYHITPDENNFCFHVKAKIDYVIVNKSGKDNIFDMRFKMFSLNPNNVDNNFKFTLKINDEDVNKSEVLTVEPIEHTGESIYYNVKIIIKKALEKTENKIKAEINYDVPIYDICQSFKISNPCKSIEHKFYINKDQGTGDEWMIQANAYSTFYHKQDEDGSNYKVEQNVNDSLIIRYTDWALVGNGYCVFCQKNLKKGVKL